MKKATQKKRSLFREAQREQNKKDAWTAYKLVPVNWKINYKAKLCKDLSSEEIRLIKPQEFLMSIFKQNCASAKFWVSIFRRQKRI